MPTRQPFWSACSARTRRSRGAYFTTRTASQPADRQAIVVIPDVSSGPAWAGVAGRAAAERAFTDELLLYVDSHYRTRPGRAFEALGPRF